MCYIRFLYIALVVSFSGLLQAVPLDLADKVEALMPAVVNISTTQKIPERRIQRRMDPFMDPFSNDMDELFEQFFAPGFGPRGRFRPQSYTVPSDEANILHLVRKREATSLGSGFIIDADGYVVTNHHVIDQSDEITVTLHDDSQYTAKLLGSDPKTDLALLKIEGKDAFPFVKFGDSDTARVGNWIIAIGNPFGLGGTVTTGIVSARARDINAGPFDDFIQTDAAINRGNSGGPMFNLDGKVIGVNTAIYSPSGGSVGIGFAIPSAIVEPVIKQLKMAGAVTRGWLGVKIQFVTDDIAENLGLEKASGALVAEVLLDSPAEKAGIKVGDIILSYDAQDVKMMKKLPRFVAETNVGKRVNVEVWRDGAVQNLEVKIAKLDTMDEADAKEDTPKNGNHTSEKQSILGLYLIPLDDVARKRYKVDSRVKGVLVEKIDPEGEAVGHGVVQGDVLLEINQQTVVSLNDAITAIDAAKDKGKRSILLLISREGETLFVAVPLDEDSEKK